MVGLSSADQRTSPPVIDIPREYNAAHDLIERNLTADRANKVAYIDDTARLTYAQLAEHAGRAGNALKALGLGMEDRLILCHLDTVDWPAVFLGAIKAGIVPIAVNTLLTPTDYEFMLNDSRAKALVVSERLLPQFAPILARCMHLKHVIVSGEGAPGKYPRLQDLMAHADAALAPAPTTCDDPCLWLYSSGSTGMPKGTVHVHSSMIYTAELYARPVLGIRRDDVVFSAGKLFFAYGLGNALTFPLSVGATTILMAERPTPAAVFDRLKRHQPTIFYGVPTLYAALLASPELPHRNDINLRACTSAGEALPADLGRRWTQHFGIEILDGIGSTEMLHMFISNRPGAARYGTTGQPIPGYQLRVVNESGADVAPGEVGDLLVSGPTAAAGYWNNRERSRSTFIGAWTRTGDKYTYDQSGYYTYAGRSDDMLKVGGMFVSPFEVESALLTHPAVLEAGVIGVSDEANLTKPKAFVVLKQGIAGTPDLAEELKQHTKAHLAPYKYPRWIQFVGELPKTATGKIQRFKLRTLRPGG